MLERQREGPLRAKREGKNKGRVPTARAKAADFVKLAGEGVKREDFASRRRRRLDLSRAGRAEGGGAG